MLRSRDRHKSFKYGTQPETNGRRFVLILGFKVVLNRSEVSFRCSLIFRFNVIRYVSRYFIYVFRKSFFRLVVQITNRTRNTFTQQQLYCDKTSGFSQIIDLNNNNSKHVASSFSFRYNYNSFFFFPPPR